MPYIKRKLQLTLLCLAVNLTTSKPAFAVNTSEIHNFTRKQIYIVASSAKDVLKIPSHQSRPVTYQTDQVQVYIFKSFRQHASSCIIDVSRFYDVFVSGKSEYTCELRAKRVPFNDEW